MKSQKSNVAEEKQWRATALQDAGARPDASCLAKRLGVRQSFGAFVCGGTGCRNQLAAPSAKGSVSKAVEGHRTPRRWRAVRRPVPREASWSAPVLWRFCFAAGRREVAPPELWQSFVVVRQRGRACGSRSCAKLDSLCSSLYPQRTVRVLQ